MKKPHRRWWIWCVPKSTDVSGDHLWIRVLLHWTVWFEQRKIGDNFPTTFNSLRLNWATALAKSCNKTCSRTLILSTGESSRSCTKYLSFENRFERYTCLSNKTNVWLGPPRNPTLHNKKLGQWHQPPMLNLFTRQEEIEMCANKFQH